MPQIARFLLYLGLPAILLFGLSASYSIQHALREILSCAQLSHDFSTVGQRFSPCRLPFGWVLSLIEPLHCDPPFTLDYTPASRLNRCKKGACVELLIDTANSVSWKRAAKTGLFAGITTNPLIMQKAGLVCDIDVYKRCHDEALALGFSQIQFQVFGEDWSDAAEQILELSDQTIVKVPATEQGYALVAAQGQPERTTLTGVYAVRQAAFAEALGVKYVAPYYARLQESARDAEQVFEGIRRVCSETRILTASLRSFAQVEHLMSLGHNCFTLPAALLDDLLHDEMTAQAVQDFKNAEG